MARDRDTSEPPRAVVVEDHAPMRAYIVKLLEKEFIVARVVADAESLLAAWREANPDVIVLDISLPGWNGFEAATRLRAAGCGAPIVFCSVHQEPEYVAAAWKVGAAGYVAKRDMSVELVSALRCALRGKRFVSTAVAGS
jgi:DNA-binding NarL/FixJ family response regulator